MEEYELREIVNKYYPLVEPKTTKILNLDRFGEKVSARGRVYQTIIVNSDSFEINFGSNKHLIFNK